MRTTRLVRSSVRSLGRHRLRTAFVMMGSLVGVAALTFVLTVGSAAQRKVLATTRQLFGASSVVVTGGGGFFLGGPRGESARLTLDDAAAIAEIPQVEAWDPIQVVPGAQVRRGDEARTVRLIGGSERGERVWDRGVSRGEYFDAAAVAASSRVALIGETVARSLFGDEDPLGAEMLVGPVPFRVLGVLEPLGTDVHGMDRDNEVVIPISTAMRRVMNVDVIRAVKVLVRDPAAVDGTAEEVKRLLRERHGLASGQPADFTLLTSSAIQRTVRKVQRVITLYLPLVAGISLLAGGMVAATLMLSAVSERVGEIGLRRAVGARTRDIRLQFLVETAVTALGGGLAGAALGTGLGMALARRMSLEVGAWPVVVAVAAGLGVAALTGLLAGVAPARRAALLEPATALR